MDSWQCGVCRVASHTNFDFKSDITERVDVREVVGGMEGVGISSYSLRSVRNYESQVSGRKCFVDETTNGG